MAFIADVLLMAGALGAGLYCHILSRRLRQFTDLKVGVGEAVSVLSAKVDELGRTLQASQHTARASVDRLANVSDRAEAAARHLELLVASMHDLPKPQTEPAPINPFFVRRPEHAGGRQ